jgi:hypothetical protein
MQEEIDYLKERIEFYKKIVDIKSETIENLNKLITSYEERLK